MDFTKEMTLPVGYDPDEPDRKVTLRELMAYPQYKKARFLTYNRVEPEAKSAAAKKGKKRAAIKDRTFHEVPDSEVDYELTSPAHFMGSHVNMIPLQSATSGAREFYGARFANQALPLVNNEAPLVQNLDPTDKDGRSFDEIFGKFAGAVKAKQEGVIHHVDDHKIQIQHRDGSVEDIPLHHKFPFNRSTQLHQTPLVKIGDKVAPGQVLAKSNYTDKEGVTALGLNARIGLVPYKGHSMDDAVVISSDFAKRLTSNNLYGYDLDYKHGVKGGKAHYTGLFNQKFVNEQLDKLDDEGIVKPGQVLNQGDPVILATKPRVVSSTSSQLGLLSKHMKNARTDGTVLWDHETPGRVVDVKRLRSGVKVNIETEKPTNVGDKISLRSGAKAIVSEIIPQERMPRTVDGQPLEVLLNHLSIPSRVNNGGVYEINLGKLAKHFGKPYKLPSFLPPGEKWHDFVEKEFAKAGISDTDEVFDPATGKKLENPITVGNAYVLRLHHVAESKRSERGQGSYDVNAQPTHGGGEGAKSKRMSGLESNALLSAGAYHVLRDSATVRGTKNDEYWRQLRQGFQPQEPGEPFVWGKLHALLNGSGYMARKLPGGKERLQFFTDNDLEKHKPLEVKTGDIVDLNTMEPKPGGLFDPALSGGNAWGYVNLPFKVPSPAAEVVVRRLLGLTEKELRGVMAGEIPLPDKKKRKEAKIE